MIFLQVLQNFVRRGLNAVDSVLTRNFVDGSTLGLLGLVVEVLIYVLPIPTEHAPGTLEHIRNLALHL